MSEGDTISFAYILKSFLKKLILIKTVPIYKCGRGSRQKVLCGFPQIKIQEKFNMKNTNYKFHNQNNRYNSRPRCNYTKSLISAVNRAYRETNILSSYDASEMISYITSHQFKQSPAQPIHSIIDTYKRTNILSSYDAESQIWKLLRRYSR